MSKQCSVEGCKSAVSCKKLCNLHYKRLARSGGFDRIIRENGEGSIRGGYVFVRVDGRRENKHILVAEKALGKSLPPGAEVHHVDRNRQNNVGSNLVICPDRNYHRLLHKRQRALEICGNPSWELCYVCKSYDSVENLNGLSKRGRKYHKGTMREACNSNRGL